MVLVPPPWVMVASPPELPRNDPRIRERHASAAVDVVPHVVPADRAEHEEKVPERHAPVAIHVRSA
jgi:hypothetical protein